LGVKYALFYVLVGAQMPSALVEVSFLSNRQDERLLRDRRYLQEVAEGIARGIKAYLGDVPLRYLAQR
jgi:N-acetylmuramoyl-L-alanine amidase